MNKMQPKPQWLTFRRLREFSFTLLVLFAGLGAQAQCTNASSYGSATASATIGTAVTISTCSYYGEYSTVSGILAGSSYTSNLRSTSSLTSALAGFITIHQGSPSGPVVGFGPSPLTWTSTVAGTYYCHWNSNSSCGTDASCHATQIIYNGSGTGCSGTPAAGTTTANGVSGTNGGCPSQAVALAVNGATTASGLTYQWQYSATGAAGSYANITGATSTAYSIASFAAGNVGYYQRIISCGANSSISTPVSVTLNSPVSCYCTPVYTSGTLYGDLISQVQIPGTTLLNNSGTTAGTPSYVQYLPPAYIAANYTANLIAGNTYNCVVTIGSYNGQGVTAWIDFNDDGIFSSTERIGSTPTTIGTAFGTATFPIVIPCNPVPGPHRLRVRCAWLVNGPSIDPCVSYGYGETEDYLVTIDPPLPCPAPSAFALTAGSATTNGGTFSWVAGCVETNWQIEYGPTGFTPGTGSVESATTNPFTTTAMPCGTTQDVYLRANCLGNGFSSYVGPISITTTVCPCAGIPSLGNTLASVTSACTGSSVTFSLPTSQLGYTYQWYSNVQGAISGATNPTYTQAITTTDDFWCSVTCANSGLTGTSNPVTVTVLPCILMSNGSVTACSGNFYDSGGPTGQYANNENNTLTINPTPGNRVQLTWNNFASESGWDFITIYDGPTTASPVLYGPSSGLLSIPTFVSSDISGALTVKFTSDGSVVDAGWDATINCVPNPACSGTPNPGNTIASVTSVCPGATVNLSIQNAVNGTGIAFQWYSNTLGPIPGATNSTYSTTLSAPSDDFWCDVTCTNTSQTVTANPVTVTLGSFLNCYCSAGLGGMCGTQSINSVAISPSTLNNVTGGCTTPYSVFPATGSTTAILTQGNAYSMTVGTGNNGNPAQIAFWIDYDHSGTFDASEYTLISSSSASGGSSTISFTVPVTSLTGQTGMRVRSDWASSAAFTPGIACSNLMYGETEQYIIEIVANTACSGTPNPGNTLASAPSVCPGGTVTLSLSNAATLGSGVTYQWNNNSGPIAGATGSFYTATINATDDYFCTVTCSNGGAYASSNPVNVALSSFYACYCASGATTTFDEEIYSVTVNGSTTPAAYAGTAGCTTPAPGPGSVLGRYSNFTTLGTFATMMEGAPVSFTVEENECDGAGYYAFGTAIFIDFNHNGSYADAGEQVFVEPTTAIGPRNVVGTFTVPFGVMTGQTGMRIIAAESYAGASLTPCLSFGYGETEDFIVDITPAVSCTGSPVPGNALASASSVCPNASVSLSLQNQASLGGGNTYQWYNNAGAITGATNATYNAVMTAPNSFYCVVTCAASGQSGTSSTVSVGLNNFFSCYCTANLHSSSSPCIDEISFNTLLNNTAAAGCALPAYTAFPAATSTTTLMQGLSYNLTRTASGTGAWTGVWIDYDHSGTFDVSEYTNLSTVATGALTNTVSITIPLTSLTGQTGMRIRQRVVDMTAADACTPNFGSGETEDYVVDIQAATPCSGTPAPGNTIASATAVCSGTTVNFSLQNATIGSGVTYQWYNNSGAIAGATNSTYSQVMTAADAFYCAVTCSGQTGISASVAITINAPLSCYCAAGATTIGCTTGDEYVGNVTLNTINNTSTCPASGQYSDFTTISTNLIQGSTYTASVLIPNWFGGDQASVWIDFNQDGILDDVTEQFPLTTGGGSGATPLSGPVTVPATALTGPTRMRVRGNYTGVMSSCGITTYGEVEDYTVIINPAVTSTTLNLTAYIQAYWNGTSAMNPTLSNQMQANPTTDCDSITVELRTASSPLTVAYSTVAVLQTNGTAACVYPSGVTSGYYYIAVKGRNMIETWSADSVSISGATAAYNFTTSAAQAYGGNMIELTTANVPNGLFAFYSGDIVKDAGEATDLLDLNQLETEINNFSFGYYAEDLNGDGNVDILDTPSLEGNISAFIYSIHP